jgi:hypothetical protein
VIRLSTFLKSDQHISVLAIPSPSNSESTGNQLHIDAIALTVEHISQPSPVGIFKPWTVL